MAEQSTFWGHFARTLPFMLFAGIVGPIFLVIGIAADGFLDWALWWGIAITLMDVALAAGVARSRSRADQKMRRLAATGRDARADVLSVEDTNTRINDQPLVRLRLRIHGDDVAPFEVEERKTVPTMALPLLHVGSLAVRVDPETREYEIDWAASSRLASSGSGAEPTQTPAERLAELDELLRKDLISTDEHAASRRRILDGI